MAAPTPDDAVSPTQGIVDSPSSAQHKGGLGSLDLQPDDMADSTPGDTTTAPMYGIENPSSTQREGQLGFLDIPPEVRNRIYGYLFSNNTIHVDGTMGNPENKFTLMMDLCTAPSEGHANVGRLTGAAHLAFKAEDAKKREEEAAKPRLHDLPLVPVPVQTEEDEGRKVCDSSNVWFSEQSCHRGFQLSTQMLRTCRQVYEDAALLPYATNTFHFSGGLHDIFCDAFIKQFSLKQRHAIKTAIVVASSLKCVQNIPNLLPGLKHLWLLCWGRFRLDLEEYYARVKLPNLVGVAVQCLGKSDPSPLDDHYENLELALLDNKDRGDLELCQFAWWTRWRKNGVITTYAPLDAPLVVSANAV